MERRLHNLEVAVRHLQQKGTTKIVTDVARDSPPLSPAAGWTFIAVHVGSGDSTKYAGRAARLATLAIPDGMDRAWVLCSVAAYAARLQPYIVPHPLELAHLQWDSELEARLTLQYTN
jgi:hypothetical protein